MCIKVALIKSNAVIASAFAFSREAAGRGGKQSRNRYKTISHGSSRRRAACFGKLSTPRDDGLVRSFLNPDKPGA